MTSETFNPFTYGNPINDPKRFFGRARELDQIFSRLRNPQFESTSVVGEHRMGRSSLLLCMSHPDVIRRRGLDPNVYLLVYVHLDIISRSGTPNRFYQYVLRRISTALRDPELGEVTKKLAQQDSMDVYELEDLLDMVDRKGLYIALLLDDFEHLASNDNFGPDFYYGLRSLAIHHHLALVTASVNDLVDLSRSDSVRSSPFFNIFATIYLQPFAPADIQSFLKGSLEGTGVNFTEAEVDHVLRLAGRQPFFLQIAFHFLYESHSAGEDPARRLAAVEERFQAAAYPHFQSYWQQSTDNERIAIAILGMKAHQQEGSGAAGPGTTIIPVEELLAGAGSPLAKLTRRGLVIRTAEGYALFSSSFARWVFYEITTAPQEVAAGGAAQGERDLTVSLSSSSKARAGKWLNTIHTKYNDLLFKWLSDSRTAEKAVLFLEGFKDDFGRRDPVPTRTISEAAQPTPPGAAAEEALAEAISLLTKEEQEQARRHLRPEGTVSILFTDLEGSTTLFQTLGDQRARELMRTHDRILRNAITINDGDVVKHTGDGFMAVFSSARKALACSIGIQQEIEAFTRDHPETPLRVRIGVNAGEVLQEEQDFFGTHVILAARIMGRATGGQILVSDLLRRLVGSTASVTYIDRGRHELSGFEEAQLLYEVDWRASKL